MWDSKVQETAYITVEDESFNMYEARRTFSTRATEHGFINIISSDYLLKDYRIINKSFNDKVTYTILLPIDKLSILGGYTYEIINEEYIEKNES